MKMIKGMDFGSGLLLGLAAAVVMPYVIEFLSNISRPVAKTAVKGGLIAYDSTRSAYDKTRQWAGGAVDAAMGAAGNLASEARSEMKEAAKEVKGKRS